MKQIKKLGLTNGIGKMTRSEMKDIMAGGAVGPEEGDVKCKNACTVVSESKECCSGMTVSGNYPPCGGDRGKVCL
jgi:hypothetical protein